MYTKLTNCILWFSLWLLTLTPSYAQNPTAGCAGPTYNIKTCFGAVGDGVTNDQVAFEKAAAFFNQLYSNTAYSSASVLIIPSGKYVVGRQVKGVNPLYEGFDVMRLSGCRNLTIQGDANGSSSLIYATQGLRYGSFDPATGNPLSTISQDRGQAATMGTCISMNNCLGVKIQDLTLDGNDSQITLGGPWGDTGIQLNYDGIFAGSSRNVTIQRVNIRNFGRDGIQCLDYVGGNPSTADKTNFAVYNTNCVHNGRNGLSLTGANYVSVKNSHFNFNGSTVAANRTGITQPAAGVDIEPEGSYVMNTTMNACQMICNSGQGLVSDRHGAVDPAYPKPARNTSISNTTIIGTRSYAIWLTQPEFRFTGCTITGEMVHGPGATTDLDAPVFTNCNFNDNPYLNPETGLSEPAAGFSLIHCDNGEANRMKFVNCQFKADRFRMMYMTVFNPTTDADLMNFENCSFRFQHQQYAQFAFLQGVKFVGNTKFYSDRQTAANANTNRYDIFWGGNNVAADTKFIGTGKIIYDVNLDYQLYQGNLSLGANWDDNLSMTILDQNAVVYATYNSTAQTMTVGPNSSITVKSGGSLEILGGKLVLNGNIIVENGGYLCVTPSVQVTGNGRFIMAPGAIISKHPTLYSTYSNDGCNAPLAKVGLSYDATVTPQLDDSYRLGIKWLATPSGGTGTYSYAWEVDKGDGNGFRPVRNSGDQLQYNSYFKSSTGQFTGQICARVTLTSSAQTTQASSCYSGDLILERVPKSSIYPNPADTYLSIRTDSNTLQELTTLQDNAREVQEARLYNSFGQLKYVGHIENYQLTIKTGNLPDGVYNLNIVNGRKVTNQKVVIRH